MIKTIIIDDEAPSREVLQNFLTEYCKDVEIIATTNSVKTAVEAIRLYQPDLIFLDIELPDGSGFDVLHALTHVDFKVIFITAFSEYAFKAFRYFATDYLLKPVSIDQLMEAVGRARKELSGKMNNMPLEELLRQTKNGNNEFTNIIISDVKGFKVYELRDIVACEGDSYCTKFYFTNGKMDTSSKNLKAYEETLADSSFVRVHHSFLINLIHVKSYQKDGTIMLTNNIAIPLGQAFKRSFIEQMKKFAR